MWNSTSRPHCSPKPAAPAGPAHAAAPGAGRPAPACRRRTRAAPATRPCPAPRAAAPGCRGRAAAAGCRPGRSRAVRPGWRLEHLEHRAVRAVLQQQRADHAHAVVQRRRQRRRHQRLAAQHAVQVAPADAHLLDTLVVRVAAAARRPPRAAHRARRRPGRTCSRRGLGGGALAPGRRLPLGRHLRLPERLPALRRRDAVDGVGPAGAPAAPASGGAAGRHGAMAACSTCAGWP
jgi:hypothetical protein